MANCAHLISSHADVPVMRPPAILRFTQPSWRFTFLQHGVIKDDLSRVAERQAHRPVHHQHPARVRLDRRRPHALHVHAPRRPSSPGCPGSTGSCEQGQRFGPEQRDLILVAPTWRDWLVPPLEVGSQKRTHRARGLHGDRLRRQLARAAQVARAGRGGGATRPHGRLPAAPQHAAGPAAAGPAAARAGAELPRATTSRSCSRGPRCW